MKKYRLLLYFVFCSINCLSAQNNQVLLKYLASAKTNAAITAKEQQLSFMANNPQGLPRLERLELRTETNDFDPRKQEFLFRASPKSRRLIKSYRDFTDFAQQSIEQEKQRTLNNLLKEKYLTYIRYYYEVQESAWLQRLHLLHQDKENVMKKRVNMPDFDILKLIDIQDKKQELARKLLDLETSVLFAQQNIRSATKREVPILADEIEPIISTEDLLSRLKSEKFAATLENPQIKVLQNKVQTNALEQKLIHSKNHFGVSYLQAQYGYDPKSDFQETFSVGVGFNFPLKGAGRLELNELNTEKYELESDLSLLKDELSQKQTYTLRQLENLERKYNLLKQQLQDSQAEYALKEYQKLVGVSPLALLTLKENSIEKELLLVQLQLEIALLYIEKLHTAGQLGKTPLQNYLSLEFSKF